jgi:hypothetical protein
MSAGAGGGEDVVAPTSSTGAAPSTHLIDLPKELLWLVCIWLTEAEAFAALGSVSLHPLFICCFDVLIKTPLHPRECPLALLLAATRYQQIPWQRRAQTLPHPHIVPSRVVLLFGTRSSSSSGDHILHTFGQTVWLCPPSLHPLGVISISGTPLSM